MGLLVDDQLAISIGAAFEEERAGARVLLPLISVGDTGMDREGIEEAAVGIIVNGDTATPGEAAGFIAAAYGGDGAAALQRGCFEPDRAAGAGTESIGEDAAIELELAGDEVDLATAVDVTWQGWFDERAHDGFARYAVVP